MRTRKPKPAQTRRKTSPDGSKVHVYLLVPVVLHDWLHTEAQTGGFKNIQDKIVDVLRSAHQARQEQPENATQEAVA